MAEIKATGSTDALRSQIQALEEKLRILNHELAREEQSASTEPSKPSKPQPRSTTWPLEPDEYKRYGRQMILPQIGRVGV